MITIGNGKVPSEGTRTGRYGEWEVKSSFGLIEDISRSRHRICVKIRVRVVGLSDLQLLHRDTEKEYVLGRGSPTPDTKSCHDSKSSFVS